jgi:prepilin peptidase CpaA
MTFLSTPALAVAFAAITPLMLYVIYSDLKTMKIPNKAVLAVFAVFLATASWGLPFDTFLWRLLAGLIAFVIGYFVYMASGGNIGGGDVKLLAALVPFVPLDGVLFVLGVFALSSLALILFHQAVRIGFRKRTTGWKTFDQAVYVPLGVALGFTMILFLGMDLYGRLGQPAA